MNKNSISLQLTEPVIFLRTGSDSSSQSRRRRRGRAEYPPALLRGLLTLKIVKPTRIKSIDVILDGSARTDWPDVGNSVATRRMEVSEEKNFLHSKIVLFHAEHQKRSRTVGPGSLLDERRPFPAHHSTATEAPDPEVEPARGRRNHRETDEGPRLLPLTMFHSADEPLAVIGERVGESGLDPDSQRPGMSSDPVLAGPSVQEPRELPPQYSSVVPTKRPTTIDSTLDGARRRRSTRLSLSGMLQDVREIVQKHPHRHNMDNESVLIQSPVERLDTPEDVADWRGRSRARKDKGAIARLGEALGIDMDDDDTEDDDPSWKEFKPGTYHYPISFTLPCDLPPSITADYAHVQYKLKAYVHRPGTFTSKLSASVMVELVTAPAEDDAEEGDAVIIERQWDTELQYLISTSGRNFPQGCEIPWHIQLMPLSKMKLHRITFVLEEKTEYTVTNYNLTRTEPVRRFQLLCIRHPQSLSSLKTVARNAPALLPILPQYSSDNSSEAVLLPYADPPPTLLGESNESEHQTEALAHLLNLEGPWHLAGTLKVPLAYLHVSHKHPISFVNIKHSLKVFLRVERGEDDIDPKTGHKKQFDIIIETPINVLSKYTRSDWASLPPYETLEPLPTTESDVAHELPADSRDSSRSDLAAMPLSPVVSPAHPSRPPSPTSHPPSLSSPTTSFHSTHMAESPRPSSADPSTPIDDTQRDSRMFASQRFASLMAGFEDEGGQLPPTYFAATGTPGAAAQMTPITVTTRTRSPSQHPPLMGSGRGSPRGQSARRQTRGTTPSNSRNASRNPSRARESGSRHSSRGPDRGPPSLFQPV